jgi:hypothetical protein
MGRHGVNWAEWVLLLCAAEPAGKLLQLSDAVTCCTVAVHLAGSHSPQARPHRAIKFGQRNGVLATNLIMLCCKKMVSAHMPPAD